jgi:hypothetical protein
MGDRTNFHFKVNEDMLTLYSHWGGYSRKQDLARALNAAMPRIQMGDIDYALRICISQLVGEDWTQETGYGLMINNPTGAEEEHGYLEVDFNNGIVLDDTVAKPFKEFIAYYLTPVAANATIEVQQP